MRKITSFIAAIIISSFSISFAQSPGGVAAGTSNQIWLDAFQLGATNGQAIQNWTDFSVGNNTASQALGARRPIYRTNGINGMPALDFDGVNDYMEIASNPSSLDGNQSSHFIVFERSTVNLGSNCLFNMDFDEASNLIYTNTSPSNNQTYVKNSLGMTRRLYFGVGTNQILSSIWNGASGTLLGYVNGNVNGPITNCANTATGHNLTRIGAFNTNYIFNGNIAEVIYYTSVLNSAERNIVENYLAAKYQISIAQDMYGHELTHRYDVVGIGQEASGNNLSASGTSNLTLSASTMNNGDYVLVGHDNAGYVSNTTDVPSGYNRYNQVWRSTLTNYSGTVNIAFDVSSLGLGADTAYKLLVDVDGVFATGATEYNGVFAGGIVTFTGVSLTSTSYFTLANADFAIVSTGVTNDWHLPTTWTCGCVPTLGSDVTILTGHNVFINGQNAQVGSLTIDGSLSFNSTDTLQVNGDVVNNNIVTPGTGTFYFTGASLAQNISGNLTMYSLILDNPLGLTINNSASIQGWLDILNGTLTTNNNLTLRSNASGTAAYYRPVAGEINGDITVERFLNEGESYYLLAPVVSGGNLEDWNQEFEMQGFTGTEWPGGISSVYYYDQNNIVNDFNQGYTVPNSTFNVIDPKVGYEIYVGDDTKATGARTIDITGTVVVGNVSYNCPHIVKTGNPANDGWSLITNPYPAPVRWGSVPKSGSIDNAYRKRTDGSRVSIGNSWFIASGEAIWIHANPGGGSINFQSWLAGFNEDITDTYNNRLLNQNNEILATVKLGYTHNNTTEYDIAYVGFDVNATDNKDSELDAYKLNNIFQHKPNLSTINNGYRLERNVLSMNTTTIIPINIKTDLPNNTLNSYTLAFEDIATLLKNNKVLTFEDTELNVSFKLTEDTVYSFTMYDTVTTNRFLLYVSTPLVTEQNNVTCYGASNGNLIANGYANDAKNYVWKDGFNNVVATSVNKLGADTVKNLMPGIYIVEVTNNVTSESVMNTFEITEPQDISSSFLTLTNNENEEITSSATVDTVNVIKGVEVFFENNSENTTIFNWNFGDLTNSSIENPGHIYFNTGVYKVELTSSNGSCSKKSEQYVNVENTLSIDDVENNLDFQLVNISNGFDLILNNDNVSDLSIVINNSLGQEVLSKNLRVDSNYRERFQLEDAQGIYYVTLKSSNTSVTKKIVLTKN
ncbi:MAG: hypothetical protein CMD31_09620 [Flavobacteriales bacterium]|nr:T9SS type A sorting domain-containing protein [Flavobacteriales bacterium]MBQ21000.1 hypothetical protein [Flavobacteriales bacterium]|tara:strand:- start:69078 stop:72632 length:3555 start_codon:yes stop_codon:yes gene_type:complete